MSVRRRFRQLAFAAAAGLSLAGGAPAATNAEHELPPRVQRVLAAYDMAPASYSAWVQDVDADAPLLAVNAALARNPASTIKLLTTFLALEDLGPAYTWRTEVYLHGQLEEGRLDGDLYLKGYGDPYLVTERVWLLLRGLRQRGLQDIEGDLVIDNSFFEVSPEDPGAFDGQRYRVYNVAPEAFLVNFRAVNFIFRPDPDDQGVQIVADPAPSNLEIRNQLKLREGRCGGYQGGIRIAPGETNAGGVVTFSGRFGRDCPEYRLSRAVMDASEFSYGVVRSLWEESGGTLKGTGRSATVGEDWETFYEFDSPPVSEVIRGVNKWSNNVMSRQVFLTMGAERFGAPGTVDKARDAAAAALAERGLDFPELRLDNGAGLSRDTQISARNLARLLLAGYDSPYRSEFESSLALAGLDGTMRRRFRDDQLTGQMHIKTGRLNGVFAMAGYLRAASGRDFVVVAMQNHPQAHRGPGEEAHTALLRWVYAQ
ncbi:MAG: D-alanyl-D-alanine carboxypeptidase/D-alanyl-D-alanine-endopeptidase [Chromatiales bacterium]|nr:MAG: D-alanyl-D-alanine carboxypeptidase/D-alanyl-D-alanine-endopeptidase [Chromatiales bacterium]